jgi:hypothetical protein
MTSFPGTESITKAYPNYNHYEAGTLFYLNQNWDPCIDHESYTISGITFTPDRHNIMSYFPCEPHHVTPMQKDKLIETLLSKAMQGLSIQ